MTADRVADWLALIGMCGIVALLLLIVAAGWLAFGLWVWRMVQ